MRLEVRIVGAFEGGDDDLPVNKPKGTAGGDQQADDDRLWKTGWRRHGDGLFY